MNFLYFIFGFLNFYRFSSFYFEFFQHALADVEKVTCKRTSNMFRRILRKTIKAVFGEKAADRDNFRRLADQMPNICIKNNNNRRKRRCEIERKVWAPRSFSATGSDRRIRNRRTPPPVRTGP